jgi:integrase
VYSTKEKIAIVAWAGSQTSERLRSNADILNSLTLGAGLYPAELLGTRMGNIVDLDGLLVVNVLGDNPRQVPVRRFWADTLRQRLAGRPSDALVIDSQIDPDSTTSIMVVFNGTSRAGRPDPQRMRSSWIVALLNDGVPVPLVMKAAGLKHSHSLNRYLPFVEPTIDGESLIAGSETAL